MSGAGADSGYLDLNVTTGYVVTSAAKYNPSENKTSTLFSDGRVWANRKSCASVFL